MPAHIARGNATRAPGAIADFEHVFAAQKCRLGLLARAVGVVRDRVKNTLTISPITSPRWPAQ
jgi:hypothetical protein